MDNITNVISDCYTEMIKKCGNIIQEKNNRICNLLVENKELEYEIEKIRLQNKELQNKLMTIAIENEELEEKYNSLEQNYDEIETDLINLEKKNYFEKINN